MKEQFSLGKYRDRVGEALAEAGRNGWVRRIWAKDASLWKSEAAHAAIISNSLGWLTVAGDPAGKVPEINAFANEVRSKGFTTACLLGMGGSSLCPEVCAATFGKKPGFLDLIVLDTTDPASILSAEKDMNLARTLFIVASKSGGTIESLSLQKYFFDKLKKLKGNKAGESFIAITDPGTSLEILAGELGFMRTFRNMKDIGGRYSALSYFGLAPMALLGLDIDEILGRAINMMERCRITDDTGRNPGLHLGVTLGALARQGVDKITFVLAHEIQALGFWVEQLVAESTGKEGLGILPVEGETLGAPSSYGNDRAFIRIGPAGKEDPAVDAQLRMLEAAGHPILRWELQDLKELGGEFFLWEFATAAAGAVLGINPFDQPNVQESKDNTQRIIRRFRETGRLDDPKPALSDSTISLYCSPALAREILPVRNSPSEETPGKALGNFFRMVQPRDYVALLAYVERSTQNAAALNNIRDCIRKNLRTATTLGFGPRFLHSTGQLHKGGTNNGLFIQVTVEDPDDIEIPGAGYSFGTLKKAQSIGDLEALEMHGRRAVRVHVAGDVLDGFTRLARIVEDLA